MFQERERDRANRKTNERQGGTFRKDGVREVIGEVPHEVSTLGIYGKFFDVGTVAKK